jgi:hypothetical protein
MQIRRVTDGLDYLFHSLLLGTLLLTTITFFFVFVINWEDWLFGIKMEGLPAGLLLLTKCLAAGILAYFLIRYPEKTTTIAGFAFFVYGVLFLDSAITVQKKTGGQELFSIVPAIMVIIPFCILAGNTLMTRPGKNEDLSLTSETKAGLPSATEGIKAKERYARGDTLMLILAAIITAFLFGPLVLSLGFSALFHASTPSIPVQDSLISKVDGNGLTKWQTVVEGYSKSSVRVTPSQDGGIIISGMYGFFQETDPALRVLKLDQNGNVVWDIHKGCFAYPEANLGALRTTLSTAGEYTVVMVDGFIIRLDALGNEMWHRKYPNVVVLDALQQPDGGFILAGDAHKGSPSEPDWLQFDGWILRADEKGDIMWEKKETGVSNCQKVTALKNGNLLVTCFGSGSGPNLAGNQIIAFDPQGNYLWRKDFVENNDGLVWAIKPENNGTVAVYLRGEGEQIYFLDSQGKTVNVRVLSPMNDSFNHEIKPDIVFEAQPQEGNRTRVIVNDLQGSVQDFILNFQKDGKMRSRIYSVNPTPDGGYLISSTAAQ